MVRKRGEAPPIRLDRRLMEELMLGAGKVRRFTQDTPVMPDVWLAYAGCLEERRPVARGSEDEANPAVKLLFTPYRETAVGEVSVQLRARLDLPAQAAKRRQFGHRARVRPRVVYNQTTVAATLHFEDLVRAVLPMTQWWRDLEKKLRVARITEVIDPLALAIEDPEHPRPVPRKSGEPVRPSPGLLWMLRVVGALALQLRGESLPWARVPPLRPRGRGAGKLKPEAPDPGWRRIVVAVADLIDGVETGPAIARIFAVNLNRDVAPTVTRSMLAVKADAARQLFDIHCDKLTWAIVDSGIDATHPAFRTRDGEGRRAAAPFPVEDGRSANRTRVLATYDFTRLERLLDPDEGAEAAAPNPAPRAKRGKASAVEAGLDEMRRAVRRGRNVDWQQLAAHLTVPHVEAGYAAPENDHGTHVAGILAGDWRRAEAGGDLEEDLVGVAPDLRLIDLRVLDASGRGDEFAVMAALQFVRHLNATHDYVVVHGVNLSLSIPHDVSNYACGRTPVCDESERVVAAGIVVVAAAGNQGYRRYRTDQDGVAEAYNSSSITDPGNAQAVITVGATHRYRPHVFGVSFFSSRGPTGDGRVKPDLVAPGEKITAPLPDELFGPKDGTSMAAPHVSGGAALLMARHQELVGQPGRVKEILCRTATDLGRERYFQGAGMLDILRALQAV